jgi:hypothetical protein
VTPEARAARERKQKIFVVVGGLFLVALLAIQLPKLLGGSSSSSAPTTTTDTTTVTDTGSTVTPVGLTSGSAVAPPTTAKLASFTVFSRKDPFVQQVVTENGVATAGGAAEGAKSPAESEKPGTGGTSKSFSTGASKAAAVTIVTVNGARQVLQPGMKFPTGDPLFVLVAENPRSKSVVVGIVGGRYTGGRKTATLKIGRPLTLVNTTTGAKYKISLVSVGTGEQVTQPEQPPGQP